MCFVKTINFEEHPTHDITNILGEDKVVIKVLYKESINMGFFKKYKYYSPYRNYRYIKGKLNTSPLRIGICKMSNNENYRIIVNEGFHSFWTKENVYNELLNTYGATLCKCIIPKGSTIVYDDSEIVSNQIIFIEELK